MGRLADKNLLISGGNSGIGLAAAQEFDREGARVAICGLNETSLRAAKETPPLFASELCWAAGCKALLDPIAHHTNIDLPVDVRPLF